MSWGFQNTLFFSSFFYPSDKWAFSQISLPKCHLAKAKSKNISSVWKQGSMIFPSSLSTLYDFLFTTLHLDVKSSESKRELILQVEKSFFLPKKIIRIFFFLFNVLLLCICKLPFVSFKQAFFLFIFALQFHSKDIYFHENTVREMCIYLTNRLIKILQILQLVLNLIFSQFLQD